jgi:hypothetical protein
MMWLEAYWRWLFLLVAVLLLAVVATGVYAWRHLDDDDAEGLPPLPDEDEAIEWMHDPVTTVPPLVFDELVASLDPADEGRAKRTRKPRHKPTGQWEWSDLLGRWFLDVRPRCTDHGDRCWLLHATGLAT